MKKSRVNQIMRNLHRDVGYLIVGLTLIYCISGIILLFRDKGVFVYNERMERPLAKVQSGLNAKNLGPLLLKNGMSHKFVLERENDQLIVFNKNELTYHIPDGTITNRYFVLPKDSIKVSLKSGLSEKEMAQTLINSRIIRKYFLVSKTKDAIVFNSDSVVYKKATGAIVRPYLQPKLPWFVQQITSLHKVNSKDILHWLAIVFAVMLAFLAVSSFWMYRPGSSNFKRGVIISLIGIVITITVICIV